MRNRAQSVKTLSEHKKVNMSIYTFRSSKEPLAQESRYKTFMRSEPAFLVYPTYIIGKEKIKNSAEANEH